MAAGSKDPNGYTVPDNHSLSNVHPYTRSMAYNHYIALMEIPEAGICFPF